MEDQFWILTTKYLSNEASDDDINTLFSLLESDKKYQVRFDTIVKDWNEFGNLKLNSFETKKAKEHLFSAIEKTATPKTSYILPIKRLLKVAALVTMLFGGYYLVNQQVSEDTAWKELSTGYQEKLQVILPDSSMVWINENSVLSYNFSIANERQIKLYGEAFFEVKRDDKRPFSVQSEHFTTQVLGTSFNIDSRTNKNAFVSVVSGKVKVNTSEKNNTLLLTRGDRVSFDVETKRAIKAHVSGIDNEISWIDKKFVFDNIRLQDALIYISKAYDVSFEIPENNLNNCLIKATFHKESLSDILKVICSSLDCKYQIKEENLIIISGNGC